MTPHRRVTDVEEERQHLRRRTEVALPLRAWPLWRWQFGLLFFIFGGLLGLLRPDDGYDVGRIAFFAASAYYLALAVVVVYVYAQASKVIEGKARMLPQHVRFVALGDVITTSALAAYMISLLGDEPVLSGVPLIAATVGMLCKSIALGIMWQFQLVRIHGERLRELH